MNDPYQVAWNFRNMHWEDITLWLQENVNYWNWVPGNPGYFTFNNNEDRVKFILRWS